MMPHTIAYPVEHAVEITSWVVETVPDSPWWGLPAGILMLAACGVAYGLIVYGAFYLWRRVWRNDGD